MAHQPDRRHLLDTVLAFIQADTWSNSRRIVEDHPELLTDETGDILAQLVTDQDDDRIRWTIEKHRTLLRRCCEIGVEAAFVEQTGGGDPAELNPILEELSRLSSLDDVPRRVQLCQQALLLVDRTIHPELWATLQNRLGSGLTKSPRGNRAENIESAIHHYTQALEVRTHAAFPEQWAMIHNNLANAYANRVRGKRADNVEQAIHYYQQALGVRTRQAFPEQWASTQNNLAATYYFRIRGDRAENIERAIHHYQQALEVRTRQAFPKQWADIQNNLALAHSNRIRGDRAENIECAIEHYQLALVVRTRTAFPSDWAMTQNNLALAYSDRIRGDRAENIERAIEYYQLALEIYTRTAFPEWWAGTQSNLADAYRDRIRGDKAENIERAMHHFQLALKVYTHAAFPDQWATIQNNLGLAHSDRIRGNRAENIERAIEHYQLALEVHTREAFPEDWAMTQSNIANAYRERISGDRAENIERAIKHCQRALEVYTRAAFPSDWAMTQNNMALAYRTRILGDRAENIELTIKYLQLALEIRTRVAFPEDWATTQNNMANAYYSRIRGNRAENIERAIEHFQHALKVYTHAAFPSDWAMTQNNLANAYSDRISGERADNIERAIKHYQLALNVYTHIAFPEQWAGTQNNLAIAYKNRIRGNRAEDIERAIHHYTQALKVYTRQTLPGDHRRTQQNLANLCFIENRWPEVVTAYRGALSATDLLYQAAATPEARQAELEQIRDLPPRLAYALSKTVVEPGSAPLQEAALTLEQNRARWLSEALALYSQKPPGVPQSAWQAFTTQRERIQHLQTETRLHEGAPGKRDYVVLSQKLRAAYTALDDIVAQIRRHDPTFMPAPTFNQIRAALAPLSPGEEQGVRALVYFAVSPAGTVAFVVTSTAIHPVPCPLTEDTLRERTTGSADSPESDGYLNAYTAWRESPRDPTVRANWFATLDHITHWLWDALVGPLIQTLTDLDITHATLIPQGLLGLLPLHAAWTDTNGKHHYALDDVTITYAPNARALSAARATAARVPPDRIFAIDEPQPVSANLLPNSNAEVSAACEHFTHRQVLGGDSATEQAVRDQLPHHTVLHFSCHGFAGFSQPLEGGLLMAHDETLTLRDILALRLENARLAVLSACETGIPGTELLDEVISLPTGLAQAGIAGVVASLWSVSDLSTMMLMARFYELWKRDGLEPPDALRQAQLWLRDTTNAQKADYFQTFLPTADTARLPAHIADTLYKHTLLTRPDDNDFAHSFYWAAFTYTGV